MVDEQCNEFANYDNDSVCSDYEPNCYQHLCHYAIYAFGVCRKTCESCKSLIPGSSEDEDSEEEPKPTAAGQKALGSDYFKVVFL